MDDDKPSTEDLGSTETAASQSPILPERIGPYRLLQKIGEGGMGEVYEAEQEKPVRRRVALKVIKPGMDSRQVLARFEAERQALALMDHPNVAKVFDAGADDRGRPYFAMEYVKGVRITEHCDRQRLTTHERLELFRQVCAGVQHAHQKGIIHRDIKPSNVLVQVRDGERIPKIIDFGVAKATAQRLTERTLFTELGVLIGTPEYMSPEQAEMTAEDIDTRTDVYSLGVLLYELLVGALPLDSNELRQAGFDEIRRRIREDEPSKPSTRLSTLGDASSESAKRRRTDLRTLRRQLSGDLDWITMRALEKDRARRYGSPSDLAADIERHLNHEPVQASPPNTAYRMAKFARRHRVGVALVTVSVLLILGVMGRERVQSNRIARERDLATFIVEMFSTVDREQARGHERTVREALDAAALKVSDKPEIEGDLRATIGIIYSGLDLHREGLKHFERSVELYRQTLGRRHAKTNSTLNHMGRANLALRRFEEAAFIWEELLPVSQDTLGEEDPETLAMMQNLAAAYLGMRRHDQAEPLLVRVTEARRRVLGEDDQRTTATMNNLAHLYMDTGRFEKAEPLFQMALEIRRRTLGTSHPRILISTYNLGDLYHKTERPEKAEPLFRDALDGFQRVYGEDHPYTLAAVHSRAENLLRLGRLAEAETAATDSYERHRTRYGPDHVETTAAVELLIELYEQWGQKAQATEYRSKLP